MHCIFSPPCACILISSHVSNALTDSEAGAKVVSPFSSLGKLAFHGRVASSPVPRVYLAGMSSILYDVVP